VNGQLVQAAQCGTGSSIDPVTVDADVALNIAELYVGYAWENQLRYEEFDLDDDHVVVSVYDKTGQLQVWLWVEYASLPCTKT
jgi:hypothetical protein